MRYELGCVTVERNAVSVSDLSNLFNRLNRPYLIIRADNRDENGILCYPALKVGKIYSSAAVVFNVINNNAV